MQIGESYEIARQDTSKQILEKATQTKAQVDRIFTDFSSGGLTPNNMRGFTIAISDKQLKIRFTEPLDTVVDGFTLCSVKGCKIVMNADHYPATENDGTLVCETKQDTAHPLGHYTTTPYVVSGLTNDKQYYFAAFPCSDQDLYNRNPINRREAIPKAYELYGLKINKTDSNPATRIAYTEMAAGFRPAYMNFAAGAFDYGDWANIWFVKENKPYMVKSNGTIDYELNANDYSKKASGAASDVANTSYAGNAMAKIPLIWIKRWEDSTHQYVNFCNIQLDNTYKAYAHQREDGSIMEYKMLRMFEGSGSATKMRSLSGKTPLVSTTAEQETTAAKANGSLWGVNSWSEWRLIDDMLKMISRNDNCQVAFGHGHCGTSAAMNTGSIDTKGQFFGYSEAQSVTNAVKVFHIENLWGNIWNRIAGCVNLNGKIYLKPAPPYNLTGNGFINTNLTPSGTSGGYISGDKMTEYGRVGYVYSGSATTFECDGGWFNNSGTMVALVGGCWVDAAFCGSGCLCLYFVATGTNASIGACLSCEQPAA